MRARARADCSCRRAVVEVGREEVGDDEEVLDIVDVVVVEWKA